MKVLVVNCGSSSLKYQLIDMTDESVIAKGNCERIGTEGSFLTHKVNGEKHVVEQSIPNHEVAISLIIDQLLNPEYGVIKSLDEITAIGHRLVHGGEKFNKPVIINEDVEEAMRECISLAPIHNPAGLTGIAACKKVMPGKPMVGVFDTAFHQTISKERYIYPIPYKYYEKYGIRKYGFHGTSHYYVSHRVAELMGKPVEELKTVVCHLGQGASLCAVKGGVSVDTSMGLTPIAGIPMCARCGDLDPSIVTFLMEKENLSTEEINKILNKESGVYGVSGVSADFRDIEAAMKEGNERAKLAMDMYDYTVAQYIAKYAVAMGGIDVIAFAGGVGENGDITRAGICKYLEFLGVKVDPAKNNGLRGEEKEISTDDSKVKVWLVPTNEELVIARHTKELVG